MDQFNSPVILSAKRSRTQHTHSKQPAKKILRTYSKIDSEKQISTEHCDEIRSLLLKKVGFESNQVDSIHAQKLLISEYSPRLVQLLDAISDSLNHPYIEKGKEDLKFSPDSASDFTLSSDDDDEDAVVPTFCLNGPNPFAENFLPESIIPEKEVKVVKEIKIVEEKGSEPVKVSLEPKEAPKELTSYKSETEIAISRIFELGKTASVENPLIPADAPYEGPSVITMTGFGELGRYGNQVLQYMFLKSYAVCHGIEEIQVPGWVGAGLFGLNDSPVKRAFPAAVEYRDTLANSTFTTDFIDYVKESNSDKKVVELFPDTLSGSSKNEDTVKNVDIWGWFQWNTSHFAPYKPQIIETFTPIPELYDPLHKVFNEKLRFRDGKKRTVVGLHLRLGDYKNIAASSFGYVAPTSWYLSWLEKIWPTLENPVLFVASDDVDAVLRDFSAYDPVTSESIGMNIPENLSGLKAGFFPDWFSLTQCDVLAISNSTFSFTACMMNQRPNAQFYRAHYQGMMEKIDPWNADPIVHRDMQKAGLQAALETLQIVYNTQGSRGLAKNIFYELPYYGLRSAMMKAILWRQSKSPKTITA